MRKKAVFKNSSRKNEEAEFTAQLTVNSNVNAAVVMAEYSKFFGQQNIEELTEALANVIDTAKTGDMSQCEAMLLSQAHALQSIFVNLSRRAVSQVHLRNFEAFLKLALRAQNQSRMTLETLATIKNPPLIFAHQTNVANGPQQINNTTNTNAYYATEKIKSVQNELLETKHEQRLEHRAPSSPSSTGPKVETMETVNRT